MWGRFIEVFIGLCIFPQLMPAESVRPSIYALPRTRFPHAWRASREPGVALPKSFLQGRTQLLEVLGNRSGK